MPVADKDRNDDDINESTGTTGNSGGGNKGTTGTTGRGGGIETKDDGKKSKSDR